MLPLIREEMALAPEFTVATCSWGACIVDTAGRHLISGYRSFVREGVPRSTTHSGSFDMVHRRPA